MTYIVISPGLSIFDALPGELLIDMKHFKPLYDHIDGYLSTFSSAKLFVWIVVFFSDVPLVGRHCFSW